MSKTNAFETSFLQHIFQNQPIANIGDASGLPASAAPGSLFVALFTADPGETGAGTEAAYTGYARVAVARSGAGWAVSGNQASNVNRVEFPTCTGGTSTVQWAAIMTALTGGTMLYKTAPLTGTEAGGMVISTTQNQTPGFNAGQLIVTED